jgi:3-hydroxyisobutyrate dehydrogenase-like beta-hydroxyacid dehydrogenase
LRQPWRLKSKSMTVNIHFIGVGKMGLPMAAHFLAAGHAVSVSDADPARLQKAAAQGLRVADVAAAARAAADVIFSSLPNDEALRAKALQVAGAAKRGSTFVDTSTVSFQASSDVADQCAAAGLYYLRCTVSGNNKMAEAAQLTVMASGPHPEFAKGTKKLPERNPR